MKLKVNVVQYVLGGDTQRCQRRYSRIFTGNQTESHIGRLHWADVNPYASKFRIPFT